MHDPCDHYALSKRHLREAMGRIAAQRVRVFSAKMNGYPLENSKRLLA
jgi:hypothetical protein